MKKLITELPYNKVDFRFISDHYDVHLNGSCMYNNELHEFITKFDYSNDDDDIFVDIYKLDLKSKIRWYVKQFLFEQCVGYHWTISYRKKGVGFYYRKPVWLYKILFEVYYKLRKLLKNGKRY